ncbi:MAG: hypothetical protein Q7W44_09360 [Coriobacteriia bacterium]|nr:hypothetical protein [Coriobacteriia bacterium]
MASKSPMAVNKSQTPMWMRVVIILVVASFGVGGIAVIIASLSGAGGGTTTSDGAAGTSGIFSETYQPRVDAALVAAQSNPTNPDIVIQVAHAYYEWAVEIYQSGQAAASIPFWLSAVTYYDQVLALRPDDEVALGNKAFALYYGQSADAPAALQAFIDQAADSTVLAAQVENARGMLAELGGAPAPSGEATTAP